MKKRLLTGLALLAAAAGWMKSSAVLTKKEVRTVPFFQSDEKKTLLFVADLHSRKLRRQDLPREKADYVLIGGDLAEPGTPMSVVHWNLQMLTKAGPCFFVWGNNDHELAEKLAPLLKQYGLTELNNTAVSMDNGSWFLAGVDDATSYRDNLHQAMRHTEDPVLLLSHNPYIDWESFRSARLVLSGHTHGGQIRIGPFGVEPLPGWYAFDGRLILLSSGYGTTRVPLRLGTRPAVHLIHLCPAEE
ncbi:metallophosphoesterase [Alkalicoccus chagannorensis]|uniref:metallophosphoesterase n=1 Tax=Alkalicoccus chagannorensis TaxID=427072 RepID=UPI00147737D2|nr:metallophosphoesterase [Alkalicoccus chagannorensis]